jgi:hypothetical protein
MKMTDLDKNFRKFKRRHLIYYLEIFDDESGDLLGHLVDLTVNGLKMVSREEIKTGRNIRLRLMMPEEYCQDRQVVFDAKSMWCRPDVNPEFHATGFSAPELSQETRKMFMIMINQVGFNE